MIPHIIVLVFLWIAFVVLTVVAFFAILFTGRYPRAIFEFVMGMNRWCLRGLVLVKWWLLALPHYLVVGVFAGGAWAGLNAANHARASTSWGGLISLLVLIAGVMLLFTGRYPKAIFEFVLGMNRWCLRVAAYATLMTDAYPPFRLDMGGQEPEPSSAQTDAIRPKPVPGLS